MGAAALGIVIPVLATSICRKLWKQGLSAARGRRSSQDGGGLLTPSFVLKVSALLGAWWVLRWHISDIMHSGMMHILLYKCAVAVKLLDCAHCRGKRRLTGVRVLYFHIVFFSTLTIIGVACLYVYMYNHTRVLVSRR